MYATYARSKEDATIATISGARTRADAALGWSEAAGAEGPLLEGSKGAAEEDTKDEGAAEALE